MVNFFRFDNTWIHISISKSIFKFLPLPSSRQSCMFSFDFMLERDSKYTYYQCDVDSYTDLVLNFLLSDSMNIYLESFSLYFWSVYFGYRFIYSFFVSQDLHTLIRRNFGKKLQVSIKCHKLQIFKEGVILLCQSILETRQISHLFSSVS